MADTSSNSSESQVFSELRQRIETAIAHHRGWYIFHGTVFVIAGMLAIILPGMTAVGAALLIGAVLLGSGLVQAVASFGSKLHWWSLLSSLASVFVGGLMLLHPMAGTVALATLLAVFFAVEGVAEVFLSLEFRPARNWGWLLASGIVSLVLAVILFAGWPQTTVFFLGIMIGINLLFYGAAVLALATSPRLPME